jgi:hypothetical protein
MDKLKQQLQEDARAIDAALPDERRRRLEAVIAATPQLAPAVPPRAGLRWAGLAAGAGAFAIVMLVVDQPSPQPDVPLAATPDYQELPQALRTIPLRVESADLTEPLQQELNNLRADVLKARESIERDLRGTF